MVLNGDFSAYSNFDPFSCIPSTENTANEDICTLLDGTSFTLLSLPCFGFYITFGDPPGQLTAPTGDVMVTCNNGVLSATGGGVSESGFFSIRCTDEPYI